MRLRERMRAERHAGLAARQRPWLCAEAYWRPNSPSKPRGPYAWAHRRAGYAQQGCGQPWTGRAFEIPIRLGLGSGFQRGFVATSWD